MKIRCFALWVFVASFAVSAFSNDRIAKIGALITSGRAEEARTQLQEAAAAYQKEGDVRREGLSLMLLGFANIALHDVETARANIKLAGEKLVAGGDHFGAWMGHLYAAAVETTEGRWERAIEQHEAALLVIRQAETAETLSFEAALLLGPMVGMDLGPLAPMMSSGAVKPIMLRMLEMMSRDHLGTSYMELGQLDKAEVQLTRAQDLSAMMLGAYDVSVADHIGDLRRRQWRLDEARASYRKALDSSHGLPGFSFGDELIKLPILADLAEIEMFRGDVDAALAWNSKAMDLVRPLKKPSRDADILASRAQLQMQGGRYIDALQNLRQALDIATALSDVERQASITTNIASIEFFRGDYGNALVTLERAIDLYQKVKDPMGEAHSWFMLSQVYFTTGANENAKTTIARAQEHAKNIPFAPLRDMIETFAAALNSPENVPQLMEKMTTLMARPELGDILLGGSMERVSSDFTALRTGTAPQYSERARIAPAAGGIDLATLLEASNRIRRGDAGGARTLLLKKLETVASNEMRFGILSLIAASYTKEGNHRKASRWYRKVVQALEQPANQMADDEMLSSYLGTDRRWLYDFAVEALLKEGEIAEAFDYAERARARAFLQTISNQRLSPGRGGNERLVREAEALRNRIIEWEQAGSAIPTDLANARREYRSLMSRLKTSNPEFASLTRVEPLSVDAIRKDLPAGTTLVTYFASVQGLHAWTLDGQTLHHVRLPGDRAALQRVACWAVRFGVTNARGTSPLPAHCTEIATAEEAYDLLIAPLRAKIRNERLIIVPHGSMHYIPFAALHDRKRDRYLIEDYTFTLAPSASALRFLQEKETPVNGRALVLGNPDVRLGALPGAEREAEAVASLLGTTPMLGPAATENLVHHLDGKIDLLHISAHGRYDSVSPTFSRIALAAGDGHDGNLEVHEILSSVDLSGVNLVVLSACQTAVGERSGGDDVVGMTRAILYAGSPGVISTLWDINDDASAVLMEELYKQLLRGAPAADALRAAQLALLREGDYREPKYWAAFTLTGNPAGRWNSGTSPR